MIEKLVLNNFESHKHTVIDFSNGGVFVLTGSSNAGKSSILRALRLIILNEPKSDKYINFNEDECSVKLYINGHCIERVRARNNKKNLYIVDGKELKAFGQSVPQEVIDIIGMNDINFEWQWDNRPFLLSETGGYISQRINEIMNLSLIDSSQKAVDSLKRSTKKEMDAEITKSRKLEEDLKDYEYLDDIAPVIEDIGRENNYLNHITLQKESVLETISSIETILDSLKEIELLNSDDITSIENEIVGSNKIRVDLNKIEDNITSFCNAQQMLDYLKTVNTKALEEEINILKEQEKKEMEYRIFEKNHKSVLSSLEDVNTISSNDISNAFDEMYDITDNEHKKSLAKDVLDKYDTLSSDIASLDEAILSLKKEYKEIAPDICPICGNKMNKELD